MSHQHLDNNQKCHLIGRHAEEKSRGAHVAILYVVGLNFLLFIALPESLMLRDLCNMVLTPLALLLGSYAKAYIAVFVGEVVGILILQNIAVTEKAKADFFNH